MSPWEVNPFAVLTFIVAPAILTNASSVMALGTSNRFARAIDRARALAAQVEGREDDPDPEVALRIRQMGSAQRRVLLLVRALTAFYLSVGAFAAAGLISLVGAVSSVSGLTALRQVTLWGAACAGVVGVGGLVGGSGLLVRETRMALSILAEETEFALGRLDRKRNRKRDAESPR
jgi:hypothetical protein